ncbi:peptidase S8/S53 domain-containing protein, partial [Syncephalis plumigaleata]
AVPDTAQRSRIEPDITSLHKKGLTGKGIRIGFLDDGIDYKHKALGGCFGKGCRVAYGKDYVGDKYDGTKPAAPNKTPIDKCLGHGTHVAGVAAGNSDKVIGVAPDATLGAYRVISCKGYSSTELTARAL